MGEISSTADSAFRDFATAGVPASGSHEPVKADIRATFGIVDSRVADLEGVVTSGRKAYPTWVALAAVTGQPAGTVAEVPPSDEGGHTDPVSGDAVQNSGVYAYSASPAGWRRLYDYGTIAPASTAETIAGSSNSRAVTPLGVKESIQSGYFAGYYQPVQQTNDSGFYLITEPKNAAPLSAGGVDTTFALRIEYPHVEATPIFEVAGLNEGDARYIVHPGTTDFIQPGTWAVGETIELRFRGSDGMFELISHQDLRSTAALGDPYVLANSAAAAALLSQQQFGL